LEFKHPSFLLAVLVIAAAPIFADKIPGDSNTESKGSVSAQKQAEMKGLHDLYATGDCDLGGAKLNEVRPASMSNAGASSFSQGDKSGGLGGFVDTEANSGKPPLKVIDFGSNAPDKDKGKSHGKGNGHDPGGNGVARAEIAVSEPGSQLLLLAGLAGLGILFLRRNSYQNAIE